MDVEHYEYIWKNYRHLLEPSTRYSQYLRAALFPVNESWPDAAEIEELKRNHSTQDLTDRFQEIEDNKYDYIDRVLSQIGEKIFFNYCSKCKKLAISPGSERCVHCGHEWYGTNEYRKNS